MLLICKETSDQLHTPNRNKPTSCVVTHLLDHLLASSNNLVLALHQEGDKLQQLSDSSQQSFHPPSEAPQVRRGQQHLKMGGAQVAISVST